MYCELEVLPGLETFARAELAEYLDSEMLHIVPGALVGNFADPDPLLDLRTITAAYLLETFAVPRPRALLGNQYLTAIVDMIAEVRDRWTARSFQSLRLSAAGEQSSTMQRLRDELAERTGLPPADDADLLVRVRPDRQGNWQVLVRLAPRPLATRAWRVANYPGALNACVAYAMHQLAGVQRADRVLNLCCGSATLMIERLELGPTKTMIGCDTNPEALAAAQQNLIAAGYQTTARLEAWDATNVPLPPACVDLICADLPFGQLIGTHQINTDLYPRLLSEAARVAAPRARAVFFTHEVRLLEQTVAHQPGNWEVEQVQLVRVSGMAPRMVLLRRI